MNETKEIYVTFWKPKKERMKDVLKVLKETGNFVYRLMDNYWPFPDEYFWTDRTKFN